MTDGPKEFPDLNALAVEACDMWQAHLSGLAGDPSARADLTRFLEPQRRLFADWAALMQKNAAGDQEGHAQPQPASPGRDAPAAAPAAAPQAGRAADGGDALGLAQLALRVAELEKRVRQLESGAGAARRTQRGAS